MHEFSLAQGLFTQLFRLAEQHRAEKIIIVRVEIGQFAGIVIDSFSFAFEILARERKLTREAVLEITEIKPLCGCLDCGHTVPADDSVPAVCAQCGSSRLTLSAADDLILTQVEME
ncbi:MAG: hydrogenase maturation nickel metallochaperone HypA [Deltaproteobacteria bacterium]|nr:hydrogenase maturation nickel metallochaperone HypA [Deltaproteobacteria bacterium]